MKAEELVIQQWAPRLGDGRVDRNPESFQPPSDDITDVNAAINYIQERHRFAVEVKDRTQTLAAWIIWDEGKNQVVSGLGDARPLRKMSV